MDGLNKFIKTAKNIRLNNDERDAIKQSLLNFISRHSARIQTESRLNVWSTIFAKNLNYRFTMAILLVLAILVSSGIAVGAEKALPGDILYPVKVGISEEVKGLLLVSEEAKANWEVKRVQRRLEEAEELAGKGSLDAGARSVVEANFQAHSGRVKDRLARFENKENFKAAVEVSSNFETALKAHEKILAQIIDEETDDELKKEIKPIKARVGSEAKTAKKSREKNEDNVSVKSRADIQASAEGKLKAAENKIGEVHKFVARAEAELGAQASIQAGVRLTLAEQAVAEGKAKLKAGAYGDAFVLFQKAIRIAQEAKLLVEARQKLEVEIKINGDKGDINRNGKDSNHDSDDEAGDE